jgi:hypothetical protein
VAKVDQNGDGVISFAEADVNGSSAGLPNTRLYLPATAFNRFAVTREIDDGLLAPRFAPGQRSYVLGGHITTVDPPSTPRCHRTPTTAETNRPPSPPRLGPGPRHP